MAPNEVRNIERPTDQVHKKKYGKTSIQQEMFGEKNVLREVFL